jgi:hypothetical protein
MVPLWKLAELKLVMVVVARFPGFWFGSAGMGAVLPWAARLKALHDRGLARQFKELSHTHLQQVGLAVHQPVGLVGVDGDKGGIRVEHVTQGEVDRTDGHNDSGSKGDVEVVNSE